MNTIARRKNTLLQKVWDAGRKRKKPFTAAELHRKFRERSRPTIYMYLWHMWRAGYLKSWLEPSHNGMVRMFVHTRYNAVNLRMFRLPPGKIKAK